MDIPKLPKGHYSVISSSFSTALVFDVEGKVAIDDENAFWSFSSYDDARKFVETDLLKFQDREYRSIRLARSNKTNY